VRASHKCAVVQAMIASGVNGLGLALVIPCLQSLTADFHPPESRGKAFGWMFCVSSLGVHWEELCVTWRSMV
jgi:MFS family permease